jgi:hypothetical protein
MRGYMDARNYRPEVFFGLLDARKSGVLTTEQLRTEL